MDLPATLGRYQLLAQIAQGGMADVFLARTVGAEGFEKHLVVKQIRPHLARNPRLVSLFVHEARIAVALNHPNVVQVYELGRAGDDWFIAMEHVHGRDVARILKKLKAAGRLLPLPLAIWTVASGLRGLGYAHSLAGPDGHPLGIVHGDVSPHNLIVSFTGEVKVLDFGIARLAGKGWGEEPGRPGGGKFAYMSPEQVRGEPLDPRSDVFSAGIVLYEALVGHRLYRHEDPEEKLRRVREAQVPDPREENPDIPDGLWEVLRRALARDPQDRFPRAEAFEEALRSVLHRHGLRGDATTMAAFMQAEFGDEGDPAAGDLARLAEDLAHLAAGVDTVSSMDRTPALPSIPPHAESSLLPEGAEALKTVAVVALEVSGQTDLSAACDPARVMAWHQAWQAFFRQAAAHHGGFLLPGHDESWMLLFGVPRTRTDDLDRALTCALWLRDAGPRACGDDVAALCVGVHRGEVALKREGDRVTVIGRGDTLKAARRIATSAEHGEIRVSDRAASQAGETWGLEPAPALRVRGVNVPVWRLVGRRGDRARAPGRWIRRRNEVEVLRSALVALGQGQGRVVAVTGEPGIGKTRLVDDLAALATRRRLAVHRARAWPFGATLPGAPLRDLVASAAGLGAEAERRVPAQPVARLVAMGLSAADAAVLAPLLAQEGALPSHDLLLEVTRRFFRALTESAPVLVVLEDIQYADSFGREVVAQAARVARERPLLLLVTSAEALPPEIEPLVSAWVPLAPVPPEAVSRFVAGVLGASDVDPDLLARAVADAGGNPRYLAEVVRALDRAGCVARDGHHARLAPGADAGPVPGTLGGLLEARVDALEPALRSLVQLAAVAGMRVPVPLLSEAAGLADLSSALDALLERGLWVPVDDPSGKAVAFASRALWEAVDRHVIGAPRREAHRRIAAALARLDATAQPAGLESLAHHLAASGQREEAVAHLAAASDALAARGFLERALAGFDQALVWQREADAGREVGAGVSPGEVALHRRAGEVCLLLGRTRPAERHLQVALDEAADQGPIEEEARASAGLGRLYLAISRSVEARACLEQAEELARAIGDRDLALEVAEALGTLEVGERRDAEAERLFERVLAQAPSGSPLATRAHLGLARLALRRDDATAAASHLAAARSAARRAGDRIAEGLVLDGLGLVEKAGGSFGDAAALHRNALTLLKDVGFRHGVLEGLLHLGEALLGLGEADRAREAFEQATEVARETGSPEALLRSDVHLGYLDAVAGIGPDRLDRAIASARERRDDDTRATGLGLLGRWHASRGDGSLASDLFAQAVETARACGAIGLARILQVERDTLSSD
ncbi:MAG: protein kinase [Deltaproteobacteria bacterium]|nr:protein kinase [Deltaproteobacteria bacterium]